MESYSASCYVENNDGQYDIECNMEINDKEVCSEYHGKNFMDGLNFILDDIQAKMVEPEPEPPSLEDQIAELTDLVNRLKDDKAKLLNELNALKTIDASKEKKTCAKNEYISSIDEEFEKLMKNFKKNKKLYSYYF